MKENDQKNSIKTSSGVSLTFPDGAGLHAIVNRLIFEAEKDNALIWHQDLRDDWRIYMPECALEYFIEEVRQLDNQIVELTGSDIKFKGIKVYEGYEWGVVLAHTNAALYEASKVVRRALF